MVSVFYVQHAVGGLRQLRQRLAGPTRAIVLFDHKLAGVFLEHAQPFGVHDVQQAVSDCVQKHFED